MKTKDGTLRRIGRYWPLFLAVGVAGIPLGGAVSKNGLFSSEVASWAQAIGGIASIVAAWLLGSRQVEAAHAVLDRQIHDQNDRAEKSLRDLRESGLGAMVISTGRIRIILRILEENKTPDKEALESVVTMVSGSHAIMNAFPIHLLSSPPAMSSFLELKAQIEILEKFTEKLCTTIGDEPLDEQEQTALRKAMMENFSSFTRAMDARIKIYAEGFGFEIPEPGRIEI